MAASEFSAFQIEIPAGELEVLLHYARREEALAQSEAILDELRKKGVKPLPDAEALAASIAAGPEEAGEICARRRRRIAGH